MTREPYANLRNRQFSDLTIQAILEIGYSEKDPCVSDIMRSLDCTYHYLLTGLVPKLESWDCVVTYRKGKYRRVKLTKKGEKIFERFAEIGELLGEAVNPSGDRRLDLIVLEKE